MSGTRRTYLLVVLAATSSLLILYSLSPSSYASLSHFSQHRFFVSSQLISPSSLQLSDRFILPFKHSNTSQLLPDPPFRILCAPFNRFHLFLFPHPSKPSTRLLQRFNLCSSNSREQVFTRMDHVASIVGSTEVLLV